MKRSIINTTTKFSYILCLLILSSKAYSQDETSGSYTLEFLLIKSAELPKAGEQHEIVTTITYTDTTMVIANSLHYFSLNLIEMIDSHTFLMEDENKHKCKIIYPSYRRKRQTKHTLSLETNGITYTYGNSSLLKKKGAD
jgi:hypothetical protein